jgi:hypothetical protein
MSMNAGTTSLAAEPNSMSAPKASERDFRSSLLKAAIHSLADFPPILVASSLRANTEIPVAKASPRRVTQLIHGRRACGARECNELEMVMGRALEPGRGFFAKKDLRPGLIPNSRITSMVVIGFHIGNAYRFLAHPVQFP